MPSELSCACKDIHEVIDSVASVSEVQCDEASTNAAPGVLSDIQSAELATDPTSENQSVPRGLFNLPTTRLVSNVLQSTASMGSVCTFHWMCGSISQDESRKRRASLLEDEPGITTTLSRKKPRFSPHGNIGAENYGLMSEKSIKIIAPGYSDKRGHLLKPISKAKLGERIISTGHVDDKQAEEKPSVIHNDLAVVCVVSEMANDGSHTINQAVPTESAREHHFTFNQAQHQLSERGESKDSDGPPDLGTMALGATEASQQVPRVSPCGVPETGDQGTKHYHTVMDVGSETEDPWQPQHDNTISAYAPQLSYHKNRSLDSYNDHNSGEFIDQASGYQCDQQQVVPETTLSDTLNTSGFFEESNMGKKGELPTTDLPGASAGINRQTSLSIEPSIGSQKDVSEDISPSTAACPVKEVKMEGEQWMERIRTESHNMERWNNGPYLPPCTTSVDRRVQSTGMLAGIHACKYLCYSE